MELHEHIQKRKDDSYYRVLPMYSGEKRDYFTNEMLSYFNQFEYTHGISPRVSQTQIFRFIDDNNAVLYYDHPNFRITIRKKLIELSAEGLQWILQDTIS